MRSRFSAPTAIAISSMTALAFLSACSDTTAPTSLRSAGGPSLIVGPTPHTAPVQVTLASTGAPTVGATQFCSGASTIHSYTIPGTFAAVAGCGSAFDLESNLVNTYNPGWSAPLTGSVWIGPNATSNEYKTAPGTYVFQSQFTIPTGVTNPVLNDTLKSDNAVAVFLNGFPVAAQIIADCPDGGPCNWDGTATTNFVVSDNTLAHFNIGGTNTVTVLLVDTPNGGTSGNSYACVKDPQDHGWKGFTFTDANAVATATAHQVNPWTRVMTATTGCENPTGLDFHGNVSWTTPATTTWCSPGYWKNHTGSWSTTLQNTPYNSLSGTYAHDPQTVAGNPTLLTVISNPSTYKGPATNNVADIISNALFGTPIGKGVESCPLN